MARHGTLAVLSRGGEAVLALPWPFLGRATAELTMAQQNQASSLKAQRPMANGQGPSDVHAFKLPL